MDNTYRCNSCDADWSDGGFTDGCTECGGGAMTRNCILCNGKCGAEYSRAVIDSWDSGEAHWIGSCRLPEDEKRQLIQNHLAEQSK